MTEADRQRRQALRTLAAVLGSTLAGSSAAQAEAPILVPEIKLRASDGHAVLSDEATAAGKWRATYIDFWASWCTPCKLSFPWMNQMHERYASRGLRLVAVGLDRKEADAQRFLKSVVARMPLALDMAGESASLLNVLVMPSSYLISADRRLLLAHKGFRLEDTAALEAQIKAALA
jgi:cytochrome c biogenesis protein CcmG, thiol:disulfide interchange protein DsbE